MMAMPPNYNMHRNERRRAKLEKSERKQLARQERSLQRKLDRSRGDTAEDQIPEDVSSTVAERELEKGAPRL
jgi:hypothetical protein